MSTSEMPLFDSSSETKTENDRLHIVSGQTHFPKKLALCFIIPCVVFFLLFLLGSVLDSGDRKAKKLYNEYHDEVRSYIDARIAYYEENIDKAPEDRKKDPDGTAYDTSDMIMDMITLGVHSLTVEDQLAKYKNARAYAEANAINKYSKLIGTEEEEGIAALAKGLARNRSKSDIIDDIKEAQENSFGHALSPAINMLFLGFMILTGIVVLLIFIIILAIRHFMSGRIDIDGDTVRIDGKEDISLNDVVSVHASSLGKLSISTNEKTYTRFFISNNYSIAYALNRRYYTPICSLDNTSNDDTSPKNDQQHNAADDDK